MDDNITVLPTQPAAQQAEDEKTLEERVEFGGTDVTKAPVDYEDAARAEDFEHSLGFWQSVKVYKKVAGDHTETRRADRRRLLCGAS